MNCASVKKELQAYLDHELDGQAEQAVAAHLTSCCACRDQAALLKAIRAAIPGPAPVSAGFTARLQAKLRQRSQPREPLWSFRPWKLALAASLACCLLVVALAVRLSGPQPPRSAPDEPSRWQDVASTDRCLVADCKGS